MIKGTDLTEQKADLAYLNNKQEDSGKYEIHPEQQRHSLVARLRAGDRNAAAELVDEYYQRIYLFMRRLGHDRQISEDLTQESFFNAWHHIGQLRDGKALDSWLYRIAANVSKLYWRRHKHKEVVGIDIIEMAGDTEDGRDRFGHFERLDELKTAVGRLPRKLKETIVLHYMQQLTIVRAAEALGIKEGTFKSRLNKALRALRKDVT